MYFYNLDLAGFISNQNQDLKLSDNFKININFFLTDKNIIICSDQDFIIKSELLTSTNFEKKFIECSRNKNIAKLSVFIDNTNVLKKYQGKKYNDYLLITKETQISKIFNNIKRYIQSRIPAFHQTLEEKINEKKNEINQIIYDIKENLTSELLIEKLKNNNDFCFDLEKLVNDIKSIFPVEFENENNFGEELQNNEKAFEELIKKEYITDFKSLFSTNLSLLLNNIKSILLYEHIINNSFKDIIFRLWNVMYLYPKKNN